ncbi:hypothetical protein EN829_062165 [Mesorhizobium sp. M00.F.Ca.ET.186.01.1.1]|nr:hypothetical protein EN829_062165 [Mesorhizobium sp. M00.F.Ca.ET.186.01.1.1]
MPDLFTYSSVAELADYIRQGRSSEPKRQEEAKQQDSFDSFDQQLQSILDNLSSGEQSVEEMVDLLSQRRNRTDE